MLLVCGRGLRNGAATAAAAALGRAAAAATAALCTALAPSVGWRPVVLGGHAAARRGYRLHVPRQVNTLAPPKFGKR